jgi:hypothetical protein
MAVNREYVFTHQGRHTTPLARGVLERATTHRRRRLSLARPAPQLGFVACVEWCESAAADEAGQRSSHEMVLRYAHLAGEHLTDCERVGRRSVSILSQNGTVQRLY